MEELFRHVEEQTDLDLFAITDHDSTDSARAGLDLHRAGGYRFDYIPGVEVTNQAGHLLCYFPSGEIHDIPSLRPFWWTVRYASERGALCIAAHPIYPPWLAGTMLRGLEAGRTLDGVEAVNAGIGMRAAARLDKLTTILSERVALLGNSDAHDASAVAAAGTEFPGRSIEDFVRALHRRETVPVFVRRPAVARASRAFTTRRSMTRPGWVRNLWREVRGRSRPV